MSEIATKFIKPLHITAIVGIGFILTLPIILHGAFDAHDLSYHLKWSKHFVDQFWSGDVYPRWLQNMNAGLGSPTFFFYAPIPYYFTSLFHPLFAYDTQSWYQLSFSVCLALIASGITAYVWLKSITKPTTALIGSILYMILPYHLAVNLYWRFAFAEFWALVWLPLILYFTKKIITDNKKIHIIGFAVSYALLIMTHLPTLVMFSVVPIAYVLTMSGNKIKQSLTKLVIGMTLAIGLSAIYWLPAMTTQEYVSMQDILEKGYLYSNNFLFSSQAETYHNKNFWSYLNFLALYMAILAVVGFIISRKNLSFSGRRENKFWLAIALFSIFIMLPISQPIWHLVPAWQKIQFPWRFNTVLLVSTTALLTLAANSLSKFKLRKIKYLTVIFLLATSLVISNGIVIKQRLKPRPNYDPNTDLKISLQQPGEYRPIWSPQNILQPEIVTQLSNKYKQAAITKGEGKLSIQEWKPRKIILQTNAISDLWLTVGQFYYPGWTAKLKDESRLLSVQPSPQEGLLLIRVPRGNHQVILTLNAGQEERTGQIFSAISAMVILFLFFWFQKSDRANQQPSTKTVYPTLVIPKK